MKKIHNKIKHIIHKFLFSYIVSKHTKISQIDAITIYDIFSKNE
jgi:hypothetical protein